MPKRGHQKLKLLYTLDILKKYSDEENPLNASQIVSYLSDFGVEAERKSVYDDIACLEFYGCDIIKCEDSKKGWYIGSCEFELPEIYLLCDAVRSVKFISRKKSRELIKKLSSMLSINQIKKHEKSVYFGDIDKSDNESVYYNIDTISAAIEDKKQIIITYSSRAISEDRKIINESRQMLINPYALAWANDHYYLVGNYAKYDNLIHLRLDRIKKAEKTEKDVRHFSEVSPYKEKFDIADYTGRLFGMYGGELKKVELCADKKIAEQIFDRFSEDIFIKNVTENEFSFSVNVAFSDALVTYIINYGDKLKVISPAELQDMIVKRAEDVLKLYD